MKVHCIGSGQGVEPDPTGYGVCPHCGRRIAVNARRFTRGITDTKRTLRLHVAQPAPSVFNRATRS